MLTTQVLKVVTRFKISIVERLKVHIYINIQSFRLKLSFPILGVSDSCSFLYRLCSGVVTMVLLIIKKT